MCRQFEVSTSGFYEWRQAQAKPCKRRVEDAELLERINEIHVRVVIRVEAHVVVAAKTDLM